MKSRINFVYQVDFVLVDESKYKDWLVDCGNFYGKNIKAITYVFCSDDDLLDINRNFLKHNYYTDIITFDDSKGRFISGDVLISIDRVKENAEFFEVNFDNELKRVMAHGFLHMIGFNDSTDSEKLVMREKEVELIRLFHVEH